ncbi:hypothetical protein CVIRNUC_002359 [Coccomyxa viridis]|uniref:Uncharacterized protein n=1 Tax=Coccomyxa viridis TaxID=1274662 RepID=A0AAV1HYR9_9CHLO|nr:hypothetical protein CVIRNUC_002359 [Coccomyxa viridis]
MSELAGPVPDGLPVRGIWLEHRIRKLPEETKCGWLGNAMLDGGAARDALTAPRLSASAWGFAKLPSLDTLFGSIENGHESSFLASLTSSRTFHSPDCAHCMAELLQVSRTLEGLQGSTLLPQKTEESREAVRDMRISLKLAIKAAWSQEAVCRGIASAKGGDQDTALQAYDRALQLDANNVDAYVARGAASANQRHFSRAVADFETALEIEPEHTNAGRYLAAVRAQMAQLNINPQPRSRLTPPRHLPTPPPSWSEAVPRDQSSRAMPHAETTGPQSNAQEQSMPSPNADAAHRHSDRSPSRKSPEEQLNVKKALQIVSEHYGKRKAIFRSLTVHWCQVVQHQLACATPDLF